MTVTLEPLNGFSKFKRLNDLEFYQEFNETNAEFVQASTNEIGGIKFQKLPKVYFFFKRLVGPE